jgi:integrase
VASIQDRWVRKDKTRTERYGQGLRYLVEWVEPGGVRRRKSFASKDAAKAQVNKLNAEIYTGVYVAPKDTVLLRDYAARWEAQQIHQRASSREQIEARIRLNIIPVLGDKPIEQLTRQDVQDAVIDWSKTLAPSTVKVTYTYLSGMLKAATLDGVVRASPCVGVRLPRAEKERVRPLSTELVQRIEQEMWRPYKPLVVFCAATGMRGSEMLGLTWDRVDLTKQLVTIDRQLTSRDGGRPAWGPPKTQSSIRTISIGEATTGILRDLAHTPAASGLVFHNQGRAFNRNRLSEAWRHVRETRELDIGTGWHQLRHYAASLWISGGMSPVAVAHRLGHKNALETLETYAHLFSDDDTRAAALSDGVIRISEEVPPDSPRPT